uniref:Uncharacterized protein n=1 Tax=Tanacetum cinerariifolium TaxID=118510 RepID=A0A6L2LE07_TANCI|nr:hypothetical protein [Tanacetum cinerariifolium]
MKHGFLSQNRSEVGRGVKEKDFHRNKKNTSSGIGVSIDSEDTMNDDTPVGVSSTVQEGVTPFVVDMMVETKMQNSLDHTIVSDCFPPLSMPVTTMAGNAPGKSSYANITGKPSGKKVNVRTLFTPGVIGLMSSYARFMIELRADAELKDNIVVAFGHIHKDCPKNTSAGEKKTVKKPSQTSRGVSVGPKIGFKPQKEYRPIPKKSDASSSSNKKKCVEPTIKVSNSNSFDVFNSVDNDVEFGTNEGTTNLVNNEATSSGSFMNIDNDGEFASNTPIGEKIDKIERQICEDESDKGYSTNSLLEQLRDSYPDIDDYDPYDDDMYENHDLSKHLQSICDDLDITVHDRKKK